jgi:AAA domain
MSSLIDPRFEPPVAPLLIAASGRRRETPLQTTPIDHPLYIEARKDLMEAITSPADHRFVALIAPPGSGKTRLLSDVLWELERLTSDLPANDPDPYPIVPIRTPVPLRNAVRWDVIGRTVLAAIHWPAEGVSMPDSRLTPGNPEQYRQYGKSPEEYLELAGSACRKRYAQVLLFDEADHLTAVAHSSRPIDELNRLKDFAFSTGARIVFAGTEQLQELIGMSWQIERRTRVVHLRPYDLAESREKKHWRGLVEATVRLIEGVQLQADDELTTHLYDATLGRFGRLHDWLVYAESRYHDREAKSRPFRSYLDDALPVVAIRWETQASSGLNLNHGLTASVQSRRGGHAVKRTSASGQALRVGEAGPRLRPIGDPHPVR